MTVSHRTAPRWVRRRVVGGRGYVMLAALVVIAIAFLLLGTSLALVSSATRVHAADETSARALALAEQGLADARERVRWGWLGRRPTGVQERPAAVTTAEGVYDIALERLAEAPPAPLVTTPAPTMMPTPTPQLTSTPQLTPSSSSPAALSPDAPGTAWYRVEIDAVSGRGRHRLQAVIAAAPTGLPRGLCSAGDVVAGDLVTVAGCGVYAGGEVRGREHIAFEPAGGPDGACREWYDLVAVHAGEAIVVEGVEEHAGGAVADPYVADTDPHAGGAPPASIWRLPAPSLLGDLAAHAVDAGAALVGGRLPLDALPPAPAAAGAGGSADGVIVVARAPAGGLLLEGLGPGPPAVSPLTLVVEGDATVSAPAALTGELVVTGTLHVVAPLAVYGSLAAGALSVASPVRVELASDWWQRPPPGALSTRVVSWDDTPSP